MKSVSYVVAGVFLFIVFASSGCGPSGPSLADLNNTNILRLRAAYGIYMVGHGLTGPKSEEEFKEYLKTSRTAEIKLKRMDISQDSIDEIFISDRDGVPFKIRYGVKGMGDHPIIFEAVGVDGKRLVAFNEPVELDAAAYDKAWAGKAKVVSGMDAMSME